MKDIWTMIQACIAGVGGWLGWWIGGMDGLIYALIAFAAVDYVTGLMCAVAEKKVSSAVGFRGLCKKVLIFALVGIGHMIDAFVIGGGATIRTAVVAFYLSNEGVSLLENASRLGLPVPEKLRDVLVQLHDKEGKDDETRD